VRHKPSKISARDAFRTAEAFLEASEVLHADGKAGNDRLLVIVFATLAAFQLEMYLKCLLLVEEGLHREGHDVLKLFQSLSVKTQAELTQAHETYIADCPEFLALLKSRNLSADVLSLLDRARDAFRDFRYAHEGKGGSTWALTSLVMSIRSRILRAHPEWNDILRDTGERSYNPLYPRPDQSTSGTHQKDQPTALGRRSSWEISGGLSL
jgi:hypothetical protein